MADAKHVEILRSGVEKWNRWRNSNRRVEPDLSDAAFLSADLSGANFFRANLRDAELCGATLTGADLHAADLQNANLTRAELRSADLHGADLQNADLHGANLTATNLRSAHFYRTNLTGANLSRAHLGATAFSHVNLSKATGLAECTHLGPSSVDTHTLRLSEGLPVEFLQGCGLADLEIEATKQYHESSESRRTEIMYRVLELRRGQPVLDFYSVFISYSHADKEFAERLHDDLQVRGVRCWRDEHQMLPGDDIYEQIDRGVRLWDKIILLASEASLTSWWVDNELDVAFEKERVLMKERGQKTLAVIPLKLDAYFSSDNWQSGKKRQLRSRVAADFTGWKRGQPLPEERIEQLLRALQTNETGREAPPEPKL